LRCYPAVCAEAAAPLLANTWALAVQLSARAVSRARMSVSVDAQAKERENGSAHECLEEEVLLLATCEPGEAADRRFREIHRVVCKEHAR
jgi:hypothetical protein